MNPHANVLKRVSAVKGVRGAMLVSAPDGLVVAESLMEDVDGQAVAALAAALAGRLRRVASAASLGTPAVVQLRGEAGTLLAVPAGEELLLVAVGDREANLGLARLELLEAARSIR
jgi:predicted regulator of Ras-like GTPase activity (Roadblock/LC7/MglB family)